MKHKTITWLGKVLMKLDSPKICIVDDEDIYFNEPMLTAAKNSGINKIERHSTIGTELLNRMQKHPFDILILDVKGITEPHIAKDGMHVASLITRTTNTYVAVVSAHQFHLINAMGDVDYYIENKIMTITDFIDELYIIIDEYLQKKSSFYKKILFKIGYSLLKKTL